MGNIFLSWWICPVEFDVEERLQVLLAYPSFTGRTLRADLNHIIYAVGLIQHWFEKDSRETCKEDNIIRQS